jgi:UDP-3-O-[3-hydroxymyristoyl] glucosamine N-acyltransferase
MQLAELAKAIDAQVVGDPTVVVTACATLDEAGAGNVSFLANPKYTDRLATTQASAVVVATGVTSGRLNLLVTKDPYLAFCKAVVALHGHRRHPHQGVHPQAYVDPTATVGEGTVIYPFAFVGPRAKVGRDCILYPGAVVYDDCVLGDRVTLHANTVVGQDGFGYATSHGIHHKIPQAGNVVIEDDVELGAGCAIERAALGSTVIGKGSKFADLISIGHGTKLGAHALIVSQGGIAGSTKVGHHLTMGGQSGIAGHLTVGDNVTVAAKTGVVDDVPSQMAMIGFPAMPLSQGRRAYLLMRQLPELVRRIRELEQKIEELGIDPNAEDDPVSPNV